MSEFSLNAPDFGSRIGLSRESARVLAWILEGNVAALSRYCQNPDLKMTKKHNTRLSLLFRSCIRIAESRDKLEELKRI